eukprot:CAMPEP_0184726690 /NCGR_PEP_ID=MMETSP0314-20130426/34406_1 /TAXON_ID=38298 /ORGANISM="Rhodella maculata, Strain CCMP 736" /LENGTH=439 /DNA_ID=CAMNT_0027192165 /DNA_START=28 /DNA_END=1347 /DNA_ORIENTATION=+
MPKTVDPSPAATPSGAPAPKKKFNFQDFTIRFVAGMSMVGLFFLVLSGGHIWVSSFVILLELLVFREILELGYVSAANGGRVPHYRTTSWGVFLTGLYFTYGKSILAHFDDRGADWMKSPPFQFLLRHHSFVAFAMYITLFMIFVAGLNPGNYTFQLIQFAKTHVALFLVVMQANFSILNIKYGLFWFVLPAQLVVINDTMAYVFGRLFGRTPILAVSPKKTVEGYIGGLFATLLWGFFISRVLAQYPFLTCPKSDFTDCGWACAVTCDPSPIFLPQEYTLAALYAGLMDPLRSLVPAALRGYSEYYADAMAMPAGLGAVKVTLAPIQGHGLVLAGFASLIGPFGGFFASGLKRAFKAKDFADIIPGHGGVTDRVDCQFLMGFFTYVYLINFVKVNAPDVENVLSFFLDLSVVEQQELLKGIAGILAAKGVNVSKLLEL